MSATSLIIGGTRGIGSVIADSLQKRGDRVFTLSREDKRNKNHIKCDITSESNKISSFVDEVDYLIFSQRYRGTEWDETFDVTINGINNVITEVAPIFSGIASVVILSSNASTFVLEEQPIAYHASRSALLGLMRAYAVFYGRNNIRFNCISPTTLIKPENEQFYATHSNIKQMIERITPLGRMGDSQDIANLVEFLCSEKSSFITGIDFFVDGGLSIVGQETIARNLLDCKHKK
jgi:3-oxoacyl-[acyl-carrier protein] reductase